MATDTGAGLSPLRPRIRLRVGVTGHRAPPKLPAQSEAPMRAILDRILATIIETAQNPDNDPAGAQATGARAGFVVVSSLAEGSDRIVARAGQAAGYTLEAVLPFARTEYARDFATPQSRAEFEHLLGIATAVFELDGAPDERGRAYEAAGFVMLANIDLLVAIWDGEEAAGIGGTAQIVSRAIADGIPVVRIDPQNPSVMEISWSQAGDLPPAHAYAQQRHTFRPADEATVGLVIQDILALPDEAKASLPQYLAEKERRWNFCLWYPLLLCVFLVRAPRLSDFRLPPALADTQAQWKKYFDILPKDQAQRPAIETTLLPAFSAADHLGIFYSLVYRGTYVFNFFVAALAVTLALTGIFLHDPDVKVYLVAAEFAIIVTILVTWSVGIRRQWHRRWLEYRRLAECLRHMRILAPLGAEGRSAAPVSMSTDRTGSAGMLGRCAGLFRCLTASSTKPTSPRCKKPCAQAKSPGSPTTTSPMPKGWPNSKRACTIPGKCCSASPARSARPSWPFIWRTFFHTTGIRITPRLSALFPIVRVRIAF